MLATPSITATVRALAGRFSGSFSSSVATTARRSAGHVVGQRRRRLVDVRHRGGDRRAAVEGPDAREHLVGDDAEGVEVAGTGRLLAHGLLGADVVGRAEHLADAGVADARRWRARCRSR